MDDGIDVQAHIVTAIEQKNAKQGQTRQQRITPWRDNLRMWMFHHLGLDALTLMSQRCQKWSPPHPGHGTD